MKSKEEANVLKHFYEGFSTHIPVLTPIMYKHEYRNAHMFPALLIFQSYSGHYVYEWKCISVFPSLDVHSVPVGEWNNGMPVSSGMSSAVCTLC